MPDEEIILVKALMYKGKACAFSPFVEMALTFSELRINHSRQEQNRHHQAGHDELPNYL